MTQSIKQVCCIDSSTMAFIKEGVVYHVFEEGIDSYRIGTNKGTIGWYDKKRFETLNVRQFHDEIIAWANGAEIEYRHGMVSILGPWQDCEDNHPKWLSNYAYRVKPENPNADKITALEKVINDLSSNLAQAHEQLNQLK